MSRLRSFVPQHKSRVPSSSTLRSSFSNVLSPDPSHFSAVSRASSVSGAFEHLNGLKSSEGSATILSPPLSNSASGLPESLSSREVFHWTTLRHISSQIYSSSKAAAILDTHMGRPTAIVTGGLVCVGTDTGRTYVFDFRQQFKFICGAEIQRMLASTSVYKSAGRNPDSPNCSWRRCCYCAVTFP